MSDLSFGDSPIFPHRVYPTLPLLGLSDSERSLIETLESVGYRCSRHLELAQAYYLGRQVVQNLRIAIPKELEFINAIVGWPAKGVDPYVERLHADGFRLPGATDSDTRIADLLAVNNFDAEQLLAFTDALSMGRSFLTVGSPLKQGEAPVITVDSPLNMSVLWDLRGVNARAAMQEYWSEDGQRRGSLMVPGLTVTLGQNDKGEWEVADRDEHGFDFVPVVRMAHQPTTVDRDGRSAITPALRYYTDAASRTLLGLEVARELYSVPQKVILGAAESDFQNADQTAKSAWDTYINRVLAIERDDEGNLPEIKQMTPYDPSTFTKQLDWLASNAAGEVGATPQDMGLYTQGNPATSDAVNAGEARRDRRAENMQQMFGVALVKAVQFALRFQNDGVLPDEFRRLEVDWSPVSKPIPGVTADEVLKLVSAGVLPATSDVTLKRAGLSAVERLRVGQDRDADQGASFLQEVAHSLTAKAAKVDKSLTGDVAGPAAGSSGTPTPAQVFGGKRPNS